MDSNNLERSHRRLLASLRAFVESSQDPGTEALAAIWSAERIGTTIRPLTGGMVEIPLSDANDLDAVISALGIAESATTPAEAVGELQVEITRLRAEIAATRSHQLPHWQESSHVQAETIRRLVAALEKIAAADTSRYPNGDVVYGGFARIALEALDT